jgi:hypothetical protein
MTNIEKIMDKWPNEKFLLISGHDNAIVGVEHESYKLIYSINIILKNLMGEDEMTHEDAWEYFTYNMFSAYVGDLTPIFLMDVNE